MGVPEVQDRAYLATAFFVRVVTKSIVYSFIVVYFIGTTTSNLL